MKVSVITVAYNSAATIGDTLRSVAMQSHRDIEHIVVDGASNDDTLKIVAREGAHVARVVSERDGGIYDAMNKGLALATGDVVGFLNSDDMLADSTAITSLVEGFSDPGAGAVFGDLLMVDPIDIARVRREWRPGPHHPGALLRGWMAPHPTLYVRREVLLGCGGFDLAYRLQADYDLELRLFEVARVRSVYVPRVIVRMRMGGATTGSWRNVLSGNLEAERAARSHGFRGGWIFIATKVLSRVPQMLRRTRTASISEK
jgi:glycosyltransferase involved in cell wall biosynthesis